MVSANLVFIWIGIRGTNAGLETALDEVLKSTTIFNGKVYPVIPEGNLDSFLKQYYDSLAPLKE